MKKIIEYLVRMRNPQFSFDPRLNSGALWQFAYIQSWALLRGSRILLAGRAPRGMMLGKGARFFNISKIKWGRFLKVGDHVFISGLGKEGIRFGDHVGIGAFSRIVVSTSFNDIGRYIRIGNHVGIGEFAYLGGGGGLTIGDDCIIGQYLSCHPENHLYNNGQELIRHQGVERKGIVIGRNCWIGSKVTILDGVVIGDGCVIAAGAVVTKSIPSGSIIAGVPARVIRRRYDGSGQKIKPGK
jgi:acetyltransferase-like isoleucine patch superfamily enzyme